MKKFFAPILLLVFLFPSIAMGQSLNKNKIVGTWMEESTYWTKYYKFNKSGKVLIKNVSKDGKNRETTYNGAYVFQDNYCWLEGQNKTKSFGNMMLYLGSNHCCYITTFIADMLIYSSLGGSSCSNKTLKRQE